MLKKIHQIVLKDSILSLFEIAEATKISKQWVSNNLSNIFGLSKVCTEFVPSLLYCLSRKLPLYLKNADKFFKCCITMHEIINQHYNV